MADPLLNSITSLMYEVGMFILVFLDLVYYFLLAYSTFILLFCL